MEGKRGEALLLQHTSLHGQQKARKEKGRRKNSVSLLGFLFRRFIIKSETGHTLEEEEEEKASHVPPFLVGSSKTTLLLFPPPSRMK